MYISGHLLSGQDEKVPGDIIGGSVGFAITWDRACDAACPCDGHDCLSVFSVFLPLYE